MPICAALLKYGFANFTLYICEVIQPDNIKSLANKEYYWYNVILPSYNIAPILQTAVDHYKKRESRGIPQDTRDKIRNTLTGRTRTALEIENQIKGATNKKPLYCYDFHTKELLFTHESIHASCRFFNCFMTSIKRKLDNHKPFKCVVNNTTYLLLLFSKPL